MEKAKLKPCPFCGGTGNVEQCSKGYIVTCKRCKSNSGAYDIPEKALKAWNRRIPVFIKF